MKPHFFRFFEVCFKYKDLHLRYSRNNYSRMKYKLLLIIILLSSTTYAQNTGLGAWVEHVSFRKLSCITQAGDYIIAGGEQGIVIFDIEEREIETLTRQKGLSDVNIVAIEYYAPRNLVLVAYRNGNIDLINTLNFDVTNITDIIRNNLFLGRRKINSVKISGNLAYISMGFGIVTFNLDNFLFPSTIIMGPGGTQIEVFATEIHETENNIYAATDEGLFRASLSSNLAFFQNWQRVEELGTRPYNLVAVFQNQVFVNRFTGVNNDTIYHRVNNNWQRFEEAVIFKNNQIINSNGILLIVNDFSIKGFNENFGLIYNLEPENQGRPDFQPLAAVREKGRAWLWIASAKEAIYEIMPQGWLINHVPDGPFNNLSFNLHFGNNKLWIAPGAYNSTFSPVFNRDGLYYYENFRWKHLRSKSLNDLTDFVFVCTDKNNPKRVYASSWDQGIAVIEDTLMVEFWDENSTNGGLPGRDNGQGQVRASQIAFDSKGNTWVATSLNDNPLAVKAPNGTWQNYSIGTVANSTNHLTHLMISENDLIWIVPRNRGLGVARQTSSGQLEVRPLNQNEGTGNLPSNSVLSIAEDLDGAIWIGTTAGVGVIYTPRFVFEPNRNFDARRITFEEDGVVQALLASQSVTAIAVDGANKKWFGTENSGVFYTSADGREQIFNFNTSNSPLPSNNILDISIDMESGMVYFATDRGTVAYQGAATRGNEQFTNTYAYPNPVRPDYDGPIFIRGLVTGAFVKITDVAGNLVYETRAEGGQAIWEGRSFRGDKVQTGVYLAYMSDELGFNTFVAKILIVR